MTLVHLRHMLAEESPNRLDALGAGGVKDQTNALCRVLGGNE
jgi:hypothetical protein